MYHVSWFTYNQLNTSYFRLLSNNSFEAFKLELVLDLNCYISELC